MKKRLMMAMTTALAIGMLAGCGEKDTATTDTNASTPVATEASAPTEEAAPTEADTTAADVVTDVVEEIVYPGIMPEVKEIIDNAPEHEKKATISGKIFDTFEGESSWVEIDEETGYVFCEFDGGLVYLNDGEKETVGFRNPGVSDIGGNHYECPTEMINGLCAIQIIDLMTEDITVFYTDGYSRYIDKYGIEHEWTSVEKAPFNELAKRCGVTVEAAQ